MRDPISVPFPCPNQLAAAEAAADAFGGDAAPGAEPLHRVNQMKHNAIAAGADRMPEADRAAIDIELRAVDLARRAFETEHLPAELVVVPCRQTRQHL